MALNEPNGTTKHNNSEWKNQDAIAFPVLIELEKLKTIAQENECRTNLFKSSIYGLM